jgi:hypothetical protein
MDSAWTRAAAQGSAYSARSQRGVFIGWRKDAITDIPWHAIHRPRSKFTPDLLALAEVVAHFGTRSAHQSIFPSACRRRGREHGASSIRATIPQACVSVVISA